MLQSKSHGSRHPGHAVHAVAGGVDCLSSVQIPRLADGSHAWAYLALRGGLVVPGPLQLFEAHSRGSRAGARGPALTPPCAAGSRGATPFQRVSRCGSGFRPAASGRT